MRPALFSCYLLEWWSPLPSALLPTHPLPDVWRATDEGDAVGLAGDEKAHDRDVHQRHLVQVEHQARPESPDLGLELAQVPRLETANEPERRGIGVGRRFDLEGHRRDVEQTPSRD